MPNIAELFIFGLTAGLALAIPVGPMALLLVDTTLRFGLRVGAAGALAMASVDATYAVVVFLAGSAVASILGTYGIWFSLIGAAILMGLGAQTIYKALGQRRASESSGVQVEATTAGKTFLKFAAATVVNPPTALYFLAITPSLVGLTGSEPVAATLAFASGVFLGSAVWQQALALSGAAIRGITTPRVRTWLSLAGGAMIIALAIVLSVRAFG